MLLLTSIFIILLNIGLIVVLMDLNSICTLCLDLFITICFFAFGMELYLTANATSSDRLVSVQIFQSGEPSFM